MPNNRIIIDWFSATFRLQTVELLDMFGINPHIFVQTTGHQGYAHCLRYEGINIHFGGAHDSIWLEMSGKGCRTWENLFAFEWNRFIETVLNLPDLINITRIDVAADIFDDSLPLKTLAEHTRTLSWVSKWDWYKVEEGSEGLSVYFGSPTSDIRLRLYDKGMEQKTDQSWIRVEIQLRDENARAMCERIANYESPGEVMKGVLKHYLRFIIEGSASRKSRAKMQPYWSVFLGNVEAIKLFSKIEKVFELADLDHLVVNQYGRGVKAFIDFFGVTHLQHALEDKSWSSNPKYDRLYALHKKRESLTELP